MRYFNTERFYIFLIFLVSLIPFLGYEEFNFAMVRVENLKFSIFFGTWVSENFGTYNLFFNPYEILTWFVSLYLGSKYAIVFYFFLLQFFAGYYFFKLGNYLFRNSQISFLSSLFYILSIYSQFMSLWGIYSGGMVYSTVPFFAYQIIKLNKQNYKSVFAKLIVAYAFLTSVNLTYILYLQLFIFFIFVLKFVYEKLDLKFYVLSFLANLLLNFILISPYFITNYMQNYYDRFLLNQSLGDEGIEWKSSSSSIGEVLRGLGSVNFDYRIGDFYSYPNSRSFFNNILLVLFSYYSCLIFILSLFLDSRNKEIEKIKILILFFYILIVFLGLGVNKSFYLNFIYKQLYEIIPFFSILRDTYKTNFITNFIYAFSVGFYLNESKNYRKFLSLYIISFLVIVTLSYNYLFTDFFKYEQVKIPNYWNKIAIFSNENSDSRFQILPGYSFSIPFKFTSKYASGSDFYRTLLGFNLILPQKLYRFKDVSAYLYQNINQNVYSFYGINYLIDIKDANYFTVGVNNPFRVERELLEKGFVKVADYE